MIEATMAIIALFTICYGIFTLYDYFEEERRIKRLLAELEAKRIEKLRARETGIAPDDDYTPGGVTVKTGRVTLAE